MDVALALTPMNAAMMNVQEAAPDLSRPSASYVTSPHVHLSVGVACAYGLDQGMWERMEEF